jgi:hypothetical protein
MNATYPASGPYDFGDATLGAMDPRLFGRARDRPIRS